MALQYRVRITKKRKEAPCGQCPEMITDGVLHITVSMRMGRSPRGKDRWKIVHLHILCLTTWLIVQHVQWGERKKKPNGRPPGSGKLNILSDEDRAARHDLVVERGRLIREIIETYDMVKVRSHHARLAILTDSIADLGGPLNLDMSRRTQESRDMFAAKLAGAGIDQF